MSVIPSPNPFIHNFLPREDEPPHERALREQEEARAKAVSDAIDEQIRQDKVAFKKYQKAIKLLLLGQSESGKSTTIKNFQLKYAYKEWVQERGSWKTVIHLNLIRSVTTVLEIMDSVMKEQQDRPRPQQRSLSPSRSFQRAAATATFSSSEETGNLDEPSQDVVYDFSDKHKVLQLRLQPLSRVQRDLEKYLGSAALEPDQVPTTDNITFPGSEGGIPRRNAEFSVSVNSSWKARLLGKEDSKKSADKKHAQGLHDATEILYRCGPDIKQLWTDDVVQQVLTETEAQLKHSSGFFMDDVDRIVARDYEPSDQDVVKARLRTVGVQEYHLSIPGSTGHHDWILYDVGGSRASRTIWGSYFDNINSIIFLAPTSCFDQRLAEDSKVNRLEDSLVIWKHICGSKLLENIQLILFLNKIDLLKEKLESGVRFDKHIVNYGKHPNDLPSVTAFLKHQFKTILRNSKIQRVFYCYLTSAADTKAMATTLATIYDGVIRNALDRAQFL
ncbi:G-alpha-domain-containing protein [Thelephora terrestris]|uniref:G-alpha-domain-containing protein n=1 Tax=Thelephora terrestris TaxID=56493 RepID=A0A9P6HR36_9AGAM|nr:G-alpha-domain-containing protein [Thelephora terrestris]